jgi:hypothetical protein
MVAKKASRKVSKRSRPRSSKTNCVLRRQRDGQKCSKGRVCDPVTKRCRAPKRGSKKASKAGSKRASKAGSKRGSKAASGKQHAYCVVCKKKVNVMEPFYVLNKTGNRTTRLLKGTCPNGHNVAKIVSKEEYDNA